MQALYQWQLAGHDGDELRAQFGARPGYESIDQGYFTEQLERILAAADELDARIATAADRPLQQLDPVERAVLWIGLAELSGRDDVPARVAINEAVELAKEFGASDRHRYVNAVLDKLAAEPRAKR